MFNSICVCKKVDIKNIAGNEQCYQLPIFYSEYVILTSKIFQGILNARIMHNSLTCIIEYMLNLHIYVVLDISDGLNDIELLKIIFNLSKKYNRIIDIWCNAYGYLYEYIQIHPRMNTANVIWKTNKFTKHNQLVTMYEHMVVLLELLNAVSTTVLIVHFTGYNSISKKISIHDDILKKCEMLLNHQNKVKKSIIYSTIIE